MKLKYNVELGIPTLKKDNELTAFVYLNNYSGIIKYVLNFDKTIKDIKMEGVIEL